MLESLLTRRHVLRAAAELDGTGLSGCTSAVEKKRSTGDRPYFDRADWLWEPIPAAPILDPHSGAMVDLLQQGYHGANLWDFGVTLRGPELVTPSTPRYDIDFANVPEWGSDPFGSDTMPIPVDTPVPPGSDGHVAIADPTTNQTYNLWRAVNRGSQWGASWGAKTALDGDGREPDGYSSTGAGLARFAAVVRVSEIATGAIPHALFFSTDMAAPAANFRYPAPRSDGSNPAHVATPIPEGARVQLDPTIDIESIPGITPFEKVVAKALQTYGAYCGDNGGARMAFMFEFEDGTNPGATYLAAGASEDAFEMTHIPWARLRVLNSWNGR